MVALVPAALVGGIALLAAFDGRTEGGTPVDQPALTCEIEAAPAGNGEVALAFLLANPGDGSVTVDYMAPFLDFELRVFAADGEVRIVQPIYDTGIAPAALTIGAGETARLPTPIRLRFGPASESAADDVPTVWTLDRAPSRGPPGSARPPRGRVRRAVRNAPGSGGNPESGGVATGGQMIATTRGGRFGRASRSGSGP